ncbi:conserved hypothetical protein [Theileria orientalis strain Shintoku]|uniref:Uncharacterized protein n=1 Tax=Theileria orientalis strain Shintoku TaxID=869250 RepID=J4DPZ6_THEOR|nr:conserved hypothetical protein [Theileria orientalis strain Shintoku]BAM41569.1 conserved hypothetical protein [Theileria orientalis strain Shintoku]|eukprot:XP_009691870.1 conserved hypothetical protein [Theileria orientalis strain Shintoku]
MIKSPLAIVLTLLLAVVALLPKGGYSDLTTGSSTYTYKESDVEEIKKMLEENEKTFNRLSYYKHDIEQKLDLTKMLFDRIRDTLELLSIDDSEIKKFIAVINNHIMEYNGVKESLEKKIKLSHSNIKLLKSKIAILQGCKLNHDKFDYIHGDCKCEEGSSSLKCKIVIRKLISMDIKYQMDQANLNYDMRKLDIICSGLIKNIKGYMMIPYNYYKEHEKKLSTRDLTALYKKYGMLIHPGSLTAIYDPSKKYVITAHKETKKPTTVETSASDEAKKGSETTVKGSSSTGETSISGNFGSKTMSVDLSSIPPPPPLPQFGKSHQDLLHKKFDSLASELSARFKKQTPGTGSVGASVTTLTHHGKLTPEKHAIEPSTSGGEHKTVVRHKEEASSSEEKENAPVTIRTEVPTHSAALPTEVLISGKESEGAGAKHAEAAELTAEKKRVVAVVQPDQFVLVGPTEGEEEEDLYEDAMSESSEYFKELHFDEDEDEDEVEEKRESDLWTEKSFYDSYSSLSDSSKLSEADSTVYVTVDDSKKLSSFVMGAAASLARKMVLPIISGIKNRLTRSFRGEKDAVPVIETAGKEVSLISPADTIHKEKPNEEKPEKTVEELDSWELVEAPTENEIHSVGEGGASSDSSPATPATSVEDTKKGKPLETVDLDKKKSVPINAQIRKTHANTLVNKLIHLRTSDSKDAEKASEPKGHEPSTGDKKKEKTDLAGNTKTTMKMTLVKSELKEGGFATSSLVVLALVSIYNVIN